MSSGATHWYIRHGTRYASAAQTWTSRAHAHAWDTREEALRHAETLRLVWGSWAVGMEVVRG